MPGRAKNDTAGHGYNRPALRQFAAPTDTISPVTQAAPLSTATPELNLRRRYLVAADEPAAVVLRDLMQAGMDPEAVPRAATLIVALDEEARVFREGVPDEAQLAL